MNVFELIFRITLMKIFFFKIRSKFGISQQQLFWKCLPFDGWPICLVYT